MGKMEGKRFLAVEKQWLGSGLDSLELLIIAQIAEYQRQKWPCYVTDKQLAQLFGVSDRTICRYLEALEEKGVLIRETKTVGENGNTRRRRTLRIAYDQLEKMKIGNKCGGQNGGMSQTKWHDNPVQMTQNYRQNGVMKESLKENEKNFLKKNEKEVAHAQGKGKTERSIRDLSLDEGNEISKLIQQSKARYRDLQKKYGLEYGSVTKDFPKQWESERGRRARQIEAEIERERKKSEPRCDYNFYPRADPDPAQIEHDRMMDELMQEMLREDDDEEEKQPYYSANASQPSRIWEILEELEAQKEEQELW
ncbi:MAG: helix-turn-helix domain-containing protein [Clostridia bacterium]|nr:helix-turn-helix domain-containing protein [Clostridia bacterium]